MAGEIEWPYDLADRKPFAATHARGGSVGLFRAMPGTVVEIVGVSGPVGRSVITMDLATCPASRRPGMVRLASVGYLDPDEAEDLHRRAVAANWGATERKGDAS